MRKFKVGDKIKLKEVSDVFKGQEGEIIEILETETYPYLIKLFKIDDELVFNEDEIELINEGKIFIFRK